MEITMTKFKNKLTVGLEGKLDVNTAPELEEKLKPELKETGYLIIDMQKLKYISSAGLRVLVWAVQTLDDRIVTDHRFTPLYSLRQQNESVVTVFFEKSQRVSLFGKCQRVGQCAKNTKNWSNTYT